MFLLTSVYQKPLEEVNKLRDKHLAFLQTYTDTGKLIVAGRKNPITGGVLICNFQSVQETETFITGDPYVQNGLAKYEYIEFTPTQYPDDFIKYFG